MLKRLLDWLAPQPPKEWQSSIEYHLWQLEFYRGLISATRQGISLPKFDLTVHFYLSRDVPAFLSVAARYCPRSSLSPLEEKLKGVQKEVYPLCLTNPD